MYKNVLFRTMILLSLLLFSACNEDNNNERQSGSHAMTEEKYALIVMAIERAIEEEGLFPAEGALLVAERTSIGESTLRAGEPDLRYALDIFFPFDGFPWTQEESDLAFGVYYRANLEPLPVRMEDLAILERDMTLLATAKYEEYIAEDENIGWEQIFIDYPQAVGYIRLGNPVILEDAGFALVHVDFICGSACGTSFYALFRLDGSEWMFTELYVDRYG